MTTSPPRAPPASLFLHPLPHGESDFARSATSSASSSSASASHAAWRVGGVLGATAATGFLEACLLLERRPIPLRFATRYALSNVLPSTVWASASAELVATASGVSPSALASLNATPASTARAKQLVLVKSVRCVRQALGSYALAWSLWQAYTAAKKSDTVDRDDTVGADGHASERPVVEKVVRFAPVRSRLSRVSNVKHGAHIEAHPLSSRGAPSRPHASALAVDWRTLGLAWTQTRPHPHCRQCCRAETEVAPSLTRLKLVEVELPSTDDDGDESDALEAARRVLKSALYELADGEQLRAVAVLPRRPLAPLAALDAFDVCVNPLAVVLCELATAWTRHGGGSPHAVLMSADDGSEPLVRDVADGLLYQHSVPTRTVAAEDDDALADSGDDASSRFVIVVASSAVDGRAFVSQLVASGSVASHDTVVVVCDDSVATTTGATGNDSRRLWRQWFLSASRDDNADTPTRVLSLADTSDALLQRVRELLRDGHASIDVQRAVHRTYGPQRALFCRRDAFSDVSQCFA